MKAQSKRKWTEPAVGWGLRVGGGRPYLAYEFSQLKGGIKCTDKSYHRAVRVAIVPLEAARRAGLFEPRKDNE